MPESEKLCKPRREPTMPLKLSSGPILRSGGYPTYSWDQQVPWSMLPPECSCLVCFELARWQGIGCFVEGERRVRTVITRIITIIPGRKSQVS